MAIALEFPATNSKKARNSTKRLPMLGIVDAVIKEETDIMRPVFTIHCPANNGIINGVNLFATPVCYCSAFSRWYWITGVRHISTCVFEISCETDVLATFRNEIKATNAFVEYSQVASTPLIQDNRFPRTSSSNMTTVSKKISNFSATGCFILQVATNAPSGQTGLIETYALNPGQLKSIAQKLYARDFFNIIPNAISNPTEALGTCVWIPLKLSKAKSASVPINFNGIALGSGARAKRQYSQMLGWLKPADLHKSTYRDTSGNIVTSWADYRNFPPYTEYYIYLPGVGLTELPMQEAFGDGSQEPTIGVWYTLSIPTGDILYSIVRQNKSGKTVDLAGSIMTIGGKVGVNVPTSAMQTGSMQAIQSAVAVGASALTVGLAPQSLPYMAGTMITSAAQGSYQALRSAMSVSGNLGAWTSANAKTLSVHVMRIQYETSDTAWDCASIMGMPLFRHKQLGELTGYVKCSNAYCEIWGTSEEQIAVNSFLNGEGVLLEE